MAFHVACPITCKRICYCELGFPRSLQAAKGRSGFLGDVVLVEEFLKDPWGKVRVSEKEETVQVVVPQVLPPPPPPPPPVDVAADEVVEDASAQAKRVALQRKAAAAMVAAEDYARRFESGDFAVTSKDNAGEEGQSNTNVFCRLCCVGENEGSEKARKMLSCKTCSKKYHRTCLKNWSQNRDLFHWSSWKCPSCRICEICRRTGDPNKFLFCRRCDGAYHCYCQHPPHKNVSSGPYLCTKHTRCHSCGSNVPGNGLSVRWFLGYTCCDACGRLFVKGNYCPVCLKVYRDSESTPMVCCDVCQRWVHCQCDEISDEKYLQFQVDGNLQYKCPTCRGECYQVRDLEDAVRELWRRKDIAEKDLITSLRAAAGLPTEDEIFSISPYSDDDESGPVMVKNEYGRSLKLSLKGLAEKSPKKSKEYGKKFSNKKHSKKKGYQVSIVNKIEPDQSFEGPNVIRSHGHSDDLQSPKNEGPDTSPGVAGVLSHTEGVRSHNHPGSLKHKFVDEVMVSDEDNNLSRIKGSKSNKPYEIDSGEDSGKHTGISKNVKAKKLVINLGARKINVTSSPRSDASSYQKEDLAPSNGDKGDHIVPLRSLKISGRDGNVIKLGKLRQEAPELDTKTGRGSSVDGPEEHERVSLGKRSADGRRINVGHTGEVPVLRSDKVASGKQMEGRSDAQAEIADDTPVLQALVKDYKPSLKLKFRKPTSESQTAQVPQVEEEKSSSIKGQRSKRKRPSPLLEKASLNEEDDVSQSNQDLMDEMMDANWILKKLGRDAIGKRVEVHQPSENTWLKGVVSDAIEGTSKLSYKLDDGRVKTFELGKQGVRFVSQKQKRSAK